MNFLARHLTPEGALVIAAACLVAYSVVARRG